MATSTTYNHDAYHHALLLPRHNHRSTAAITMRHPPSFAIIPKWSLASLSTAAAWWQSPFQDEIFIYLNKYNNNIIMWLYDFVRP